MGAGGNFNGPIVPQKTPEQIAQEKKEAERLKQQQEIDALDDSSVSNRVRKALGPATDNPLSKDVSAGAAFGEAVVGEGLGRIGEDPAIAAMEAQAQELAQGFSSQEMTARREAGIQNIQGATQAQMRQQQAALARSGVKGAAAGAQLGNIAMQGLQSRQNLERDLIIADRDAKSQGLAQASQMITGNRQFDIAQAAKEKDIALQAGLGFGQMGSAERGAEAANKATVKAAKASKQSCFLMGTSVMMDDGSTKNIENIGLTDNLFRGGVTYSISSSLVSEIYKYDDIWVTGSHAVKENGKWIRVKDSAKSVKYDGVFHVFNLSNENHRIITDNGIEFADYDETDFGSNINDKESLEALNEIDSRVLEG
jgi:hypothetical protein